MKKLIETFFFFFCINITFKRISFRYFYNFVLQWTPEGRRLVTGASSGEFTLWNGLTFNFETILQVRMIFGQCFKNNGTF